MSCSVGGVSVCCMDFWVLLILILILWRKWAETFWDNLVDNTFYFNYAFVGKKNKCDTKDVRCRTLQVRTIKIHQRPLLAVRPSFATGNQSTDPLGAPWECGKLYFRLIQFERLFVKYIYVAENYLCNFHDNSVLAAYFVDLLRPNGLLMLMCVWVLFAFVPFVFE